MKKRTLPIILLLLLMSLASCRETEMNTDGNVEDSDTKTTQSQE